MQRTREELEKAEEIFLAPYAMKSSLSLGRIYPEHEDRFRLPFQRDRDRIIHCKAFRRLQAKTQVFVSYFGDHYRDRMTHSIEVSQIARDISRTLGLNEDLSECLALAHDLGHPPFGHGGEKALDEMMRQCGLHFEHNEQSRRILQKLEKLYPGFDGLNVTREVLDGLLKHNPHRYETHIDFEISPHLEAQVVDLADEIAYTNHDTDDGIRSGLITIDELSKYRLWRNAEKKIREEYHENGQEEAMRYRVIAKMISQMIADLQETTSANLQKHQIDSLQKARSAKIKLVEFSKQMKADILELRGFLMKNFYYNEKVSIQIEKGKNIVKELFRFYLKNPQKLPHQFTDLIRAGEPIEIVIKDYIAGMTDHYAEETLQTGKNR
jgi:dGTPase